MLIMGEKLDRPITYRRITIGEARDKDNKKVLVICGVPIEEPGEGIFVLGSKSKQNREGLDILAYMPKNSTREQIIQKIRDLGQGEHIKPGF